ncbi:hypothetical protein KW791_00535 [Candidatus Parcubacteria bacterium]|nr:hypothetical protein [Candidatus Parcubacteria bacterium]
MAYDSDLVRTKNWGTEILTDSDLEGQFDLIINWVMAALNATTGHAHDGSSNHGPKLSSSAVTTTFGNGFTTVSAATGDYVVIASDVSDSNKTKKALVSDIVTLAAITPASQSEMEAATNNTKSVTPVGVKWNPGVAKAWGVFNGSGTPAFTTSYNMDATITDNGTGDYTVTMTTDFSSADYAFVGGCLSAQAGNTTTIAIKNGTSPAAGSVNFTTTNEAGSAVDCTRASFALFGDQ